MGVTSWIRRQFQDNVSVVDYVPGGLTASAVAFTAFDGSTFPDGDIGDFIVTVDQGLATEEVILCASRSGANFTVATDGRGYGTNGAAAQVHAANCSILHTSDAQDFDEANQVAVATLGAVEAAGDLLIGTGAHALTRLAAGTANQFLQSTGSTLAWISFGSSETKSVAATNSDGTQTTPAHSDHVHAGVTSVNGVQGVITAADLATAFGQTNGYGIINAQNAPPVPAVSLTSTGGTLGANYTMTGTLSNFMTTGTLQPGTYIITVSGSISLTSGLQNPEIEIVQGTATSTFLGPTSATPTGTGSGTFDNPQTSFSITTVAVVTVAGALAFQAKCAAGGTILQLTTASSLAGATGWTATRIA